MHPQPCCSHCPCHQPIVVQVPAGGTATATYTTGNLLMAGGATLTVDAGHRDDPDDGVPALVRT